MMDTTRRQLLSIQAIDVSYRSAIKHASAVTPDQQEWLNSTRQRAEQLLNRLESRLLQDGPLDPEVTLHLRVVRASIQRADAAARGITEPQTHEGESVS